MPQTLPPTPAESDHQPPSPKRQTLAAGGLFFVNGLVYSNWLPRIPSCAITIAASIIVAVALTLLARPILQRQPELVGAS